MAEDEIIDNVPTDPYGDDPEGIPDPMPDELQQGAAEEASRTEDDDIEHMEGPAPTG
jgi:hypothetical protein